MLPIGPTGEGNSPYQSLSAFGGNPLLVSPEKVPGIRAALIMDTFSAHQGVEDDDMNVMCLGGRVTGYALSWDLVQTLLMAHFKRDERFRRRLAKISKLERKET